MDEEAALAMPAMDDKKEPIPPVAPLGKEDGMALPSDAVAPPGKEDEVVLPSNTVAPPGKEDPSDADEEMCKSGSRWTNPLFLQTGGSTLVLFRELLWIGRPV